MCVFYRYLSLEHDAGDTLDYAVTALSYKRISVRIKHALTYFSV